MYLQDAPSWLYIFLAYRIFVVFYSNGTVYLQDSSCIALFVSIKNFVVLYSKVAYHGVNVCEVLYLHSVIVKKVWV